MIMAIIYIFLSYVIFDEQFKIAFRKSSAPLPLKIFPLFTHSPLKIEKVEVPPFFARLKIFHLSLYSCRKGKGRGEGTISAIFFVIRLVVFAINFLYLIQPSFSRDKKILFLSFPVRLRKTILEFYLFLIGLFFLGGKGKQRKC